MRRKEMNSSSAKTKTINVTVALQGQTSGQEISAVRAYVFNRTGSLVASRLLEKGAAALEVPAGQKYRVAVGPDLLAKGTKPPTDLAAQLARAKSISQDVSASDVTIPFHIYPNIWQCWIVRCINVQGTVTKSPGDGTSTPICMGTVEILELDFPCFLDRLPIDTLNQLKFDLVSKLSANVAVSSTTSKVSLARRSVNVAASPSQLEIASNIASLTGTALKSYLTLNRAFLGPVLCELPYLLPWFCWREVAEVPIQSDGSFSAELCFFCPDLFPDLYFEVYQNIDGNNIELTSQTYALCGIFWAYDGTSSLDIIVTDPRAISCIPTQTGPGYLYVWPTAIGNEDLGQIDGLETLTGTGLLPGLTPFGGTLSLQMEFDPSLPSSAIAYYRWSYMFEGDSGFTQINVPVTHRYATVAPGPPLVITLNSVTLGPQTQGSSNNLYAIPNPNLDWVDIDDPSDRPFAYFDSTAGVTPGRSGLVTLMLEMFDSSGNFVPCNNPLGTSTLGDQPGDPTTGQFTYILPEIGGPSGTYTNAPTPNITDHGRLIFQVLVDNNPTQAGLPAVSTPEGAADSCGMLHYGPTSDTVTLDYYAYHPNNYLSWSLGITKGLSGEVAGIPPSPPPTDTSSGAPLPGSPATFVNSVSTLLGSCPQAAFAVNLYCWARATDGYSRQSEYDSSATIAFALTTP
jgi:hypothetical protein